MGRDRGDLSSVAAGAERRRPLGPRAGGGGGVVTCLGETGVAGVGGRRSSPVKSGLGACCTPQVMERPPKEGLETPHEGSPWRGCQLGS